MFEKRPSIREIAELAGVGVATVDRVLSDRAKVSHATTMKVLGALRTLGVGQRLPSGARHLFRFEVFMSLSDETFFARYQAAFQACAKAQGVQVRLRRFDSAAGSDALFQALQGLEGRCHGLALIVEDNPTLRQYCQRLRLQGKAAVFMTSAVASQGWAYAGIDNEAAGRTAGYLLGGFLAGTGRVLLVTHHMLFQSHRQRIQGFRAVCQARFPGIEIVGPVECSDTDDHAHAVVTECLQGVGPVDGIYHTGAGNDGIARAVQGHPVKGWIGHEITPANARLLQEGKISALIDQNPELQAKVCIQVMLHQLGAIDSSPRSTVPFSIVTPENLDNVLSVDAL
ncbi:LacI family DNA-binding transcriptional regulator [Pseudomonas eucalypticola]|uniref:LacI family DNA-binding transcriptional regulator n=1 Tax=Pseudomonas eucalypticola TaxID=2599595 RepID=A0A7D5HMS1_9PSED|nr:LacI family DNA-binding transcriptional regulator [Pseudomonas eucalypticola]QKZ03968.1 LacI family DNA-binding transcriptional regulator [Pseudomonas eucalypticola]